MFRVTGMFRFLPEIETAVALDHWRAVHGPMVGRIPGIVYYEQNHPTLRFTEATPSAAEHFDAYIFQLYGSQDDYRAATGSGEWAAVGADAETFIDGGSAVVAEVEGEVVVNGPPTVHKALWVGRGPAGSATLESDRLHSLGATRIVINRPQSFMTELGADGSAALLWVVEAWFAEPVSWDGRDAPEGDRFGAPSELWGEAVATHIAVQAPAS